jgi:predicted metalloprotease with PDZ domain
MNESLAYTLSFPHPQNHLAEIVLTAPARDGVVDLWMPVWTPGSYLVREYSRNVEGFAAEDASGRPLPWTKTAKNRWRVEAGTAESIRVRYRVYGREKSVRTNWIDTSFALVNGAPTFLTVRGLERRPHRIAVDPPPGWEQVHTALPFEDGAFIAPDLDTLVDSPVVLGNPRVYRFSVDDREILLVNLGEGGLWDGERAAADVEAVVRAYRDMYGGLPFPRYLFFNLIVEAGGGLEHRDSCVLMTSRFAFRNRKSYVGWLGLVSHEFFHVWNVKRSRPREFGPFDYENEVYTRCLWVAEGFTAYYTDLVPRRAGLTTEEEYLELLSKQIEKLYSTPGRALQSLEESSFDAWIKLYRADENTPNTTISYYLKGQIVGWLLDAEIRRLSQGERTLDDLMRLLFERHGGESGYTPGDLQAAAEETAGGPLDAFFARAVRSREELDLEPGLRGFGLRFAPDDEDPVPWLGIESETKDGRHAVKTVRRDGPAYEAGLNAEDEILAVGGYRVLPANLGERLKQYESGERVVLTISRDDALLQLPVTLGEAPGSRWRLEADPDAGDEAAAERGRWLGCASAGRGPRP